MKSTWEGIDLASGEDKTHVKWFCYACGKEAVGVVVVPQNIEYKYDAPIMLQNIGIAGRMRVEGKVEFIPFCKEHDAGNQTAFALRCNFEDFKKLSEKFRIESLDHDREIKL